MRRLLLAATASLVVLALAPVASSRATPAAPVAPAAPAGVVARPLGRATLAFRWQQVRGATEYDLYARRLADGAMVGPVPAAGIEGEIGGLAVGEAYVPGVRARNADGASTTTWGTAAIVAPDAPPGPPAAVQAAPSPTSTRLTVSWTEAPTGVQPDIFAVEVQDASGVQVGGFAACTYPCARRTVDGLEPGSYRVRVGAVNWSGGVSWSPLTGAFTVADGCAAGGACLTVSAERPDGAAELRAQGLNSDIEGADAALLAPLRLQDVRLVSAGGYALARQLGADVTWLVSNSWWQATLDPATGSPDLPWADWPAYDGWLTWWTGFLAQHGIDPDWWEVQNEPYIGYFRPGPYPRSFDEHADHVAHAERAIAAAAPSERVIGPSHDAWREGDMRRFLDAAVRNDLGLDALVWHELEPTDGSVNGLPSDLVEHAERARTLLAERPSLGTPEIHVNEYGGSTDYVLAGWTAGYIAALERADVDVAMRACWSLDECGNGSGSVSALFQPYTRRPLASYWVHRFYADQTGQRVESASSNANVSAFATRDGDVVRILAGRHQTCAAAVNARCDQPASATPGSFDVPVTITGLARRSDVRVTVERVPATDQPVDRVTAVSSETLVTDRHGRLVVVLPRVADGEAWLVTARPA